MDIKVITLEETAFYELVRLVVQKVKDDLAIKEDTWISPEEAMHLLRIKSATTLQKLRDEGKIRFTQPERKMILYDRASIYDYLEKHAKDTF